MAEIGKMRSRLQLQSRTTTANSYGEAVPGSWTTYATVWGQVEPLGGGEGLQAGRVVEDRTYRVTIWHRTDVQGNHSILLPDGRRVQIESVVNLEERGEFLEIVGTEVRGAS